MSEKQLTGVRTRIAPSPTGYLHLGTARTALYSWAYARHHGGQFVLRIEDTDVTRSTQDAVDQIIDAMQWLGLDYDEGPIFQMQRLARYHAVVDQLLQSGHAYRCYCSPQELTEMRDAQRKRGEKTHYDRRWRPAPGKQLPPVPAGIAPVIRFCNPVDGDVVWDDLVKGPISINNREIDDLIILRPDRVPTYNFAVVVDDWDMAITHVFRGDEHVNNTPWQINMYRALGAPLPQFGHCPVILGPDGLKLSKRRGAVSVTAYRDNGYLPEALLNYLARLGWSHGDDELFTSAQMVQWFDGSHLAKSPAMWDPAKLAWVNSQYLKQRSHEQVLAMLQAQLAARNIVPDAAVLPIACELYRERCSTVGELADWVALMYTDIKPKEEDMALHVTPTARAAMPALVANLQAAAWDKAGISAAIKQTLAERQMKMPQLAPAIRVLVCGRAETPSVDAVLALFPRATVLARLREEKISGYTPGLA